MSWEQGLDRDLLPWFRWIVSFIKYYDPRGAVSSGYRSQTEQARLYRRFLAGQMPGPVAPPGYSYHELGRAIDVLAKDDALAKAGAAWEAAGGRWGGDFKGAGKYDPIHFEA
jgi:D-alanyl-D-alanine carboxypeptidase-like protein